MTRPPVANEVMRAGLAAVLNLIQARITREFGLIRQPEQSFWLPIARALELAAREMSEARLERQEFSGRSDAALARFAADSAEAVAELRIPSDKRERLQGMVYRTAQTGLAALVACNVQHIEESHKA